jgi:hypothetical protein
MDEFDTIAPEEPDEDELSPDFVNGLVDKILKFNPCSSDMGCIRTKSRLPAGSLRASSSTTARRSPR